MIPERRLRIAFVSDTIEGRLGGGVVAGRRVVAELRRHHDVVVIAADATAPGDARQPGFVLPLRAMREMQFVMARPDRASIAHAVADADVVHLQFPFWLSLAAMAEARRAGVPVVAAFHVQPENGLLNVGVRAPWLGSAMYRWAVRNLFNRADAVVCPTAFAERKLRAYGLRTPTFVVSNGVPPDVRPVPCEREPQHRDKFLVLAVGRLAAEKRQDTIIEAVRRSRHRDRIQLVLAGAGPREEALRRLAHDLPNPVEIGFVPRERLERLRSTADLFVHASEVELEGIAVLEAMSVGLPVLVADSSESAASALAISDEFRFPVGDAPALAAKIDALLDRPEVLAAARETHRVAASAFDFVTNVGRLVGVYEHVMAWIKAAAE